MLVHVHAAHQSVYKGGEDLQVLHLAVFSFLPPEFEILLIISHYFMAVVSMAK